VRDNSNHILLLFKRLLFALFLFFVGRLFFLLLNYSHFNNIGFYDIVYAFIIGIRFDLSVILYFNFPIILMHIIPLGRVRTNKTYQAVIKYYFLIINSLLLLVNLCDSRYFDFTLRRSTAFILKFLANSEDVPILLPRFIIDYWYVPLTWAFLTLLSWYLYPKYNFKRKAIITYNSFNTRLFVYKIFTIIILLTLTFIGARGGLQRKPLTVVHAANYSSARLAPLVLNTPFTIMTTYGHEGLKLKEYYTQEMSEQIYPVIQQYEYADSSLRKINVVVLILESFSREYSGFLNNNKGYTPFLDSLMQHSLLFPNAYATATRSVDAVTSIVAGIPPLMDDPLSISVYNTNKISSIASILKDEGYQTGFFHGGNNGTMNFNGFSNMAGFDAYYGRDEYNNDEDYDGYWGIFDHAFLQYFAEELNTFKQPFYALEFTLSSHNPYMLPEKYQDMFHEDFIKIHRVIQYTDYALKQFFKTASTMPWYSNTLFVLVADHTGHSISPAENMRKEKEYQLNDFQLKYYKNTAGRFAIPLLFYFPSDSLIGINNLTVQQNDIIPSILDYMNYNKPFFAYGRSVFDDKQQHIAFEYFDNIYQITRGEYSLMFDGNQSISLFNNQKDPEQQYNLLNEEKQIKEELESTIKSIIQQYNFRMENNMLYP